MGIDSALIGGIAEISIHVPELAPSIRYFEAQGYRVSDIGEMPANDAKALYGVGHDLRTVRLSHSGADSGMIRLMFWDGRQQQAAAPQDLGQHGARWSVQHTASVLTIATHAEVAQRKGFPIRALGPALRMTPEKFRLAEPFAAPISAYRILGLTHPLYRQLMIQALPEEPMLAAMDETGKTVLQCGGISQVGLTLHSPYEEHLAFYEDVLGFVCAEDRVVEPEEAQQMSCIFGTNATKGYRVFGLDSPASLTNQTATASHCRLSIVAFDGVEKSVEATVSEPVAMRAPGALGYGAYTIRVGDIEAMHRRVARSGALTLSDIVSDEFGQRAFIFAAPEGLRWRIVQI